MNFVVPIIWFGVAIGVYFYNQQGEGHIVMFGMEYIVGNDLEARSMATIGLALFLGAITSVSPIKALLVSNSDEPEE